MTDHTYTTVPFPRIRKASVDLFRAASRKHMIHSMIEVDISGLRDRIRQKRKETGAYISLTGYLITHIARVVEKNPEVHAYRNRQNQLILFHDVDVSTTIERKTGGHSVVVPKIIRSANRKSVSEISKEIQDEKSAKTSETEIYRMMRLYLFIPVFIRRWFFRILDRSPLQMKKRAGTIMITSVNMIGSGAGWGIPVASHTFNVVIGGIVRRAVTTGDITADREHLCLTLSFDHDIVDGAPAARFTRQLIKQIQNGEI